jgi:ribosomal-protein-alanine N-acetyltransferase
MSASPAHVRIEPMTVSDLPEVLCIEAVSFGLPWTQDMFERELGRGTLSELLVARALEGGTPPPLVGYLCAWVVTDELHINNLAVDPRWRRRGVAATLLRAALDRGRARQTRRAFLEVRASNLGAQALYEKLGFAPTGIRKRYYTHPIEDAVIMVCDRL